jgi:translation initiation factor 1
VAQEKKSKKHSSDSEFGGFVYSTGSLGALQEALNALGLQSETENGAQKTPSVTLEVRLERKHRAGKAAVLISGHPGGREEIDELAKWLKTKLATGGSVEEGMILLQGDRRDKVMELLQTKGFRCKRVGG